MGKYENIPNAIICMGANHSYLCHFLLIMHSWSHLQVGQLHLQVGQSHLISRMVPLVRKLDSETTKLPKIVNIVMT